MHKRYSPRIELGPGGLILYVKANEELLEEIGRADPLPTAALLELAMFLREYMTNVPLGDRLELVGLRQLAYKPEVQQNLIAGNYLAKPLPLPRLLPEGLELEDLPAWLGGDGGDPAEEKKDSPEPSIDGRLTQVMWVSFSGVGLLIEAAYYFEDRTLKKHYYVIGVSPDPRDLQPDAKGRIRRVPINKEADPARNEQV